MFTTKYWKNAPKPKRRVKKYEDGGPVDAEIDVKAEPDNPDDVSVEKDSKSNPFNSKKWSAVSKAMKGVNSGVNNGSDSGRKRLSDPDLQVKPFRTNY